MTLFDINNIAYEIIGYQISYVELIGTLFGLISVYLATKTNILTWATGIINELFLIILFFQVQLYADMFLQVFFFVVTLYGWYNWKEIQKKKRHNKNRTENKNLAFNCNCSGNNRSWFLNFKFTYVFASIFQNRSIISLC